MNGIDVPKLVLVLLAACALPAALLSATAQERVKPKEAKDFPAVLQGAQAAWKAEQYGRCMTQLQEATRIVAEKRRQVILAALPKAPSGWEAVPEKKSDSLQGNPFAGALAGSVGNIFTRDYKEIDGRGRVTVQMTTDSPMVQMFTMWIQNPAMLGEGAELIKYGPHNAVLKSQSGGRSINLQILLMEKHVCEVTANGLGEEGLFAMFDQAAVDRLAAVLAK